MRASRGSCHRSVFTDGVRRPHGSRGRARGEIHMASHEWRQSTRGWKTTHSRHAASCALLHKQSGPLIFGTSSPILISAFRLFVIKWCRSRVSSKCETPVGTRGPLHSISIYVYRYKSCSVHLTVFTAAGRLQLKGFALCLSFVDFLSFFMSFIMLKERSEIRGLCAVVSL